ncbi:MAG: hypothetical protein EDM05_64285 [Leptolyngbya sp. IPPAS B-1204]
MGKFSRKTQTSMPNGGTPPEQLLSEIRTLIEAGRNRAAQAVNTELVLLHWHIGDSFGKLR